MSEPTIIIPARHGSFRYPGKPLVKIGNRPLIEWVWRAAMKTGLDVIVATDHLDIATVIKDAGGKAVMSGNCNNGTERCAAVASALGLDGPIVNWQGDSPLIPPEWIKSVISELIDADADVATPVQQCTKSQADRLKMDYMTDTPGGTFAVIDDRFRSLYFSKAPIPYRGPFWLHVGLYVYRAEALAGYGTEETILERSEKLEQLRFLERGMKIQCVPVNGNPIWEVNNPSDVSKVANLMGERHGTFKP